MTSTEKYYLIDDTAQYFFIMQNILKYFETNKAKLFPIIILVFLGLATFITLLGARKSQELRSKAALSDTGELTLSRVTPASGNVMPGGTFSIAVNLVNGGQAVVGADILVQFDKAKLTLTGITQGTSTVFKTFAPLNSTTGAFDTAKVISNSATAGIAEFGIVSFDWAASALTTPNASNSSMSPVATLTFQVTASATSGTTQIKIKNDGLDVTTDSNIVVNPTGSGNPEDILKAPGYANDTLNITIGSGSPAPSPSNVPSPSTSAPPSPCNLLYDFNGDGKVNVVDIQMVASRWNTVSGDPNYSPTYDLNNDGKINVVDIQMVAAKWNTQCP